MYLIGVSAMVFFQRVEIGPGAEAPGDLD